jgi:hypothetical protein
VYWWRDGQAPRLRTRRLIHCALYRAGALLAAGLPLLALAQPRPLAFAPEQTQLKLIPVEDAGRMLAEQGPRSIDPASPAEAELVTYCANGTPQRAEAPKVLLAPFLSPAIHILLNPVAARIHEELAKFSSLAAATTSVDYYRGSAPPDRTTRLEARYRCLRFTRFVTDPSGAPVVALDFIGGVGLDSPRDAILARPLRLYVSKADARSANGRYGVAIELRALAVWRDEVAGHQATVFEATLATETVDLRSRSYLKYYGTEAPAGQRVPIVPVSFGIDRSQDFGRAAFTVSVAETGAPPATLVLLGDLLPASPDSMTLLMAKAALAATNLTP